jgi:hypothetical protein
MSFPSNDDNKFQRLSSYFLCGLIHYNNVTNNFSGESFDERSFEHEFFIRISQAFPFLKVLFIMNSEQQIFKQEQESNNDNRNFSMIEYSHLIPLGLIKVHDDYAEQFLFDTKTCLSNYIRLRINYDQLQRVTQNFTRDAARELRVHVFLDPGPGMEGLKNNHHGKSKTLKYLMATDIITTLLHTYCH